MHRDRPAGKLHAAVTTLGVQDPTTTKPVHMKPHWSEESNEACHRSPGAMPARRNDFCSWYSLLAFFSQLLTAGILRGTHTREIASCKVDSHGVCCFVVACFQCVYVKYSIETCEVGSGRRWGRKYIFIYRLLHHTSDSDSSLFQTDHHMCGRLPVPGHDLALPRTFISEDPADPRRDCVR